MSVSNTAETPTSQIKNEERGRWVVRFAGDSGDGIQMIGELFTSTCALLGVDVATFPDYPAEIRAPAGTTAGVSAFQICFGSEKVYSSGDRLDVLVAFNPAAFKVTLPMVKPGGLVIVNEDSFVTKELTKAGYSDNPLDKPELEQYRIVKIGITTITREALTGTALGAKQADRCKNFCALAFVLNLFNLPTQHTEQWLKRKFKSKADVLEANIKTFEAGGKVAASTLPLHYRVKAASSQRKPGIYRHLTGNTAVALGLLAAAQCAKRRLFLGSYPITPASDILHYLGAHRKQATVFQAEDEIAAIGASIGASYGGCLAATSTSGPGFSLKSEFINLAVMSELPLVIIDVQRAGPSTGIPTKLEQSDLFQALFGRHGDSPLPVLAATSPRDCFDMTIEAAKIALRYMTPVVLLTDGYLGNGAQVFRVPEKGELPDLSHTFVPEGEFQPYLREEGTLARPWAIPGTPGHEHRLGGLEKEEDTGRPNQTPANHEKMVHLRAEKIERVVQDVPAVEVFGHPKADLLVVGWGSTYGGIREAVETLVAQGRSVACAHLRYLNPLPANLGEVLKRYRKVLVPEYNMGQMAYHLRAKYLVDVATLSKVQGLPFTVDELCAKITSLL